MATLWGTTYGRAELLRRVGRLEQIAGVRLATLSDGVERGVRVLEFRTGTGFAFDVLVDRAFDIGRCEWAGRPLAWQSQVGITGPWHYEAAGLGFLRSFGGGLLTTCGLDHTLFPTTDGAEQYHYPPKPTEAYGLHGRISNVPARLVGYGERWEGDECLLWAEGEVLQASALGEALRLTRRIEAHVGASSLRVRDRVENVGYHATPHMLLYHVNAGFPIVDDGAEILFPARSVTPAGSHDAAAFASLGSPTPGFEEQVLEFEAISEPDGTVPTAIVNRRLGLGLSVLYQDTQFAHPFIWKMLGEGTYVVAIEPSTNRVAGRHDARARGELAFLAPGEARPYELEVGILEGAGIDTFTERVAALRNGTREP